MLNKLESHSKTMVKKYMDAKQRKLTAWWVMVGAFGVCAVTGIALTATGHAAYVNGISQTKNLRKQLDDLNAKKAKDEDELKTLHGEQATKKQAEIYQDQQKIDEINGKLNSGVTTTQLAYGVFLDLLSILILAGIGLYSYGIFSKKEGILYQKKTTLE